MGQTTHFSGLGHETSTIILASVVVGLMFASFFLLGFYTPGPFSILIILAGSTALVWEWRKAPNKWARPMIPLLLLLTASVSLGVFVAWDREFRLFSRVIIPTLKAWLGSP